MLVGAAFVIRVPKMTKPRTGGDAASEVVGDFRGGRETTTGLAYHFLSKEHPGKNELFVIVQKPATSL